VGSSLAAVFTFGTFCIIIGLVVYRLLWAASSFAGYCAGAALLPKRLQRWQGWLHGEASP
jgi:hypothetical protein